MGRGYAIIIKLLVQHISYSKDSWQAKAIKSRRGIANDFLYVIIVLSCAVRKGLFCTL